MSGICCGVFAGTKFNGFIALASFLPVLFWFSLAQGKTIKEFLKYSIVLGIPFLLLYLPWLLKTLIMTGNPFYPFFYRIFGGPEWNPGLTTQFLFWQKSTGMGRTFTDFLLLPFRLIFNGGPGYTNFDGTLNKFWIFFVPLTLVFGFKNRISRGALLIGTCLFLFWAFSSQQMRLLIPALPLFSLTAAYSTAHLLRTFFKKASYLRRAEWATAVGCSLLILSVSAHSITYGISIIDDLVLWGDQIREANVHPIHRVIHRRTPPEAKILFLNTNHGFFSKREYIADCFFEASQINAALKDKDTEDKIDDWLGKLGITHVLINNKRYGIHFPQLFFDYLEKKKRIKLGNNQLEKTFQLYRISGR